MVKIAVRKRRKEITQEDASNIYDAACAETEMTRLYSELTIRLPLKDKGDSNNIQLRQVLEESSRYLENFQYKKVQQYARSLRISGMRNRSITFQLAYHDLKSLVGVVGQALR